MSKSLLLFCSILIVSCSQIEDSGELNKQFMLKDTAHSYRKNEFIHYADTAAEMNNSTIDSSIIEMEKRLEKLKEDYENDPTNSLLKDQISEMEKSLEISKSIYEDIKERDAEIQRVIHSK